MAKNKSVFGIYSSRSGVENAVVALKDAGFQQSDISVLLPENLGNRELATEKNSKAPEGAGSQDAQTRERGCDEASSDQECPAPRGGRSQDRGGRRGQRPGQARRVPARIPLVHPHEACRRHRALHARARGLPELGTCGGPVRRRLRLRVHGPAGRRARAWSRRVGCGSRAGGAHPVRRRGGDGATVRASDRASALSRVPRGHARPTSWRNCWVRASRGCSRMSSGLPCSTMRPSAMKTI